MFPLQRLGPDLAGSDCNGPPVVGFWALSHTNGQLTPSVLVNCSKIYRHRGDNQSVPAPESSASQRRASRSLRAQTCEAGHLPRVGCVRCCPGD